ncbi:M15 family metallopeptidase [Sphingomonas lenta]|nr:M15 family metallopeptidase [Sphingomonas lenta]
MHGRARATFARVGATTLLLLASPAWAQCGGEAAPIGADGRMLGHLPYGDAAEYDLADAPTGFALNRCRVRREVLPDLQRLLAAAAADPRTGGVIRGLSCHRPISHQREVFCRERGTDREWRAISAAPPGHSEHATGYAIDFAIRPSPNCPDVEACMAALPAAHWLRENATRFGFEQSFPTANGQRVKWEPWHWRWVGTSRTAPGAARARFAFARARKEFPADPGLVDPPPVVRTIAEPPPPPSAPVEDKRKRKRRR